MRSLTEKEEIVKRLLESKAISFEESLILLEEPKLPVETNIPYKPMEFWCGTQTTSGHLTK